eukprot:Rhum_TRINITY_DN15181_c5_g1::Rhum_TRINITY_DN15181_c5_g1_i2::g.143326::m.143326
MSAKFLCFIPLLPDFPCPCLCAAPTQQHPCLGVKLGVCNTYPFTGAAVRVCSFRRHTPNATIGSASRRSRYCPDDFVAKEMEHDPKALSPSTFLEHTSSTSFALPYPPPSLSTITSTLYMYPCMPALVSPPQTPPLSPQPPLSPHIDDKTKVYPRVGGTSLCRSHRLFFFAVQRLLLFYFFLLFIFHTINDPRIVLRTTLGARSSRVPDAPVKQLNLAELPRPPYPPPPSLSRTPSLLPVTTPAPLKTVRFRLAGKRTKREAWGPATGSGGCYMLFFCLLGGPFPVDKVHTRLLFIFIFIFFYFFLFIFLAILVLSRTFSFFLYNIFYIFMY